MSHGRAVPAADGAEGDVALLHGGELVAVARGRRRLAPALRGAGGAVTGRLPPLPRGSTVTVGSFDGVHLGHQAVLREIARRADAAGRASVLVTFEPHPLEVVNPQAAPPLLTTDPERREILAQLPLDYVLLVRFDRRLAALSPEEFVRAGAARPLPDARAGDRARSRIRPRAERRRGDAAAPGRRSAGSTWTWSRRWTSASQHVSSSRIRRAVAGRRPRDRGRGCSAGHTR